MLNACLIGVESEEVRSLSIYAGLGSVNVRRKVAFADWQARRESTCALQDVSIFEQRPRQSERT